MRIGLGLIGLIGLIGLMGCSSAYEPAFEAYVGTEALRPAGKGGMMVMIDGIPVWDNCEPPRPYVVLGTLASEGGRFSDAAFETRILAKGARQIGADALIMTDVWGGYVPSVKALAIKYTPTRKSGFDPTKPSVVLPRGTST